MRDFKQLSKEQRCANVSVVNAKKGLHLRYLAYTP